ncbi:MAG: murein biosynthesis integral membrane protein MurJ, partial [Elusimicrobiota bacterium]
MSTNIKIAKAYLILTAASILGHILSMGKEILVANYFGITKAMDAFYTALTIPNWITPIFSSPFILIFIPIFTKYKLTNKEEANRLASILINYTFIVLILITLFVFIFSRAIIQFGFCGLDSETSITSIKILRIINITIIFTVLVTINTVIHNANEHFLWPAVSQMFVTICTILFILFFAKKWGIFVFAWGLLIGLIIQSLFLIPFTKQQGYKHYFDFRWNHPELKKILNLTFVLILLSIISGFNAPINRIMASWLPTGSIAALGYADKLVQVPLIVFSGSIATAIYPFISKQLAENKIEEMKDALATSIKMMGFIFIPLAVIMITLAKPVIQLLFQRGAFDAQATDLTSKIFICFTFQLFSNYALVIMLRLIFAFQDLFSILKVTVIGIVFTILLNYIFIKT